MTSSVHVGNISSFSEYLNILEYIEQEFAMVFVIE